MLHEIAVDSSQTCEFIDITDLVQRLLDQRGADDGAVLLFVPHTTAGVVVNENWDPDVVADFQASLDRQIPCNWQVQGMAAYRHTEGNSPAHIKASLVGVSVVIPVHQGRLALGRWQGVYLAEFDGPRSRRVVVQLLAEAA
jgi:secondary thiamine-phosphate synthase enzyme